MGKYLATKAEEYVCIMILVISYFTYLQNANRKHCNSSTHSIAKGIEFQHYKQRNPNFIGIKKIMNRNSDFAFTRTKFTAFKFTTNGLDL